MINTNVLKATEMLTTEVPFLGGNTDEKNYHAALELMETLLLEQPGSPLIDILADRIEAYEMSLPEVAAFFDEANKVPGDIGALKTLINQYDLKLSDLPEIGSKSMVSLVLNGKRKLTLEAIKALAARFNLSPTVFI